MWFAIEMVSSCYGVDMWLTFLIKMSFFWFIIEKKIPNCKKYFAITFVPFKKKEVEDIVAKGGLFY
jgi:hypothetical protein